MAEPTSGRATWSYLLFAAVLVCLVVGAFYLKSKPGATTSTAVATSTESTQELLARGVREHKAESYDLAMDTYHKVLQRQPGNPQAHYNLAQIYNARAQWTNAQWEYEAAIKGDPKSVDARLNLGVVLYRQRKFAEAAQEFRQILQVSP